MKIQTKTQKQIVGRLSDGSDRQEIEITTYIVLSDDGVILHQSETEPNLEDYIRKDAIHKLELLDKDLNRGTEDLVSLLISKGVIYKSDLPAKLGERMEAKKQLRTKI